MDQPSHDSPSGPYARLSDLSEDLESQSHESLMNMLVSIRGLPSLFAQYEEARLNAASAFEKFESEMIPQHANEEETLFPAVLHGARSNSERESLEALTAQLTAEHRNVESLWAGIAPALRAFIETRLVNVVDEALLTRLIRDYSRHVVLEDSEFLPIAREILVGSSRRSGTAS